LGPLGQGLLDPSGIRVLGQLKQGLVSIAPKLDSLWERRFESYQMREFFNPDPIVAEQLRRLTKL
jgi:hypothetical protein